MRDNRKKAGESLNCDENDGKKKKRKKNKEKNDHRKSLLFE